MSRFKKITTKLIAISAIALLTLSTFAASAFATDPPPITPQGTSGDLSIQIFPAAKERAFAIVVTNSGTDDVIGFTLDVDFTNYSPSHFFPLPAGFAGGNATDNGTFNIDTEVWAGTLGAGQTVVIGTIGSATGAVGETISISATILSSTLGDSTPNIDPTPGNDTALYETAPIILDPNITLDTRLVTTGAIEAGDLVQYELTIANEGEGAYENNVGVPMGIYFLIPEGTTFVGVEDQDDTDNLGLTNCGAVAPEDSNIPAFAGLITSIVGCQIEFLSGNIPAGYSFKLDFKMTASGPFSTGDTKILAVLNGDETDSLLVQTYLFTSGVDPFEIESDNADVLSYDGTALVATVNPCSGSGTVLSSNTACFTLSFNKAIYEPSFDITDLKVTKAQIQSLTKIGDNLWEIQLINLTPNEDVTITISDDNDILDDSAVIAATQVLGINTVRYVVAGEATGTLPATGSDTDLLVASMIFMILGAGIVLANRRRETKTVRV